MNMTWVAWMFQKNSTKPELKPLQMKDCFSQTWSECTVFYVILTTAFLCVALTILWNLLKHHLKDLEPEKDLPDAEIKDRIKNRLEQLNQEKLVAIDILNAIKEQILHLENRLLTSMGGKRT